MAGFNSLGNGIYQLDAHYIEAGVASFYCLVEQDEVAIIETGTSYSLPYLQDALRDLDIAADQVRYVMPTHVHLDHAGGAGVMMQAFPNAELVVHPRGARHMIDPQKLIAGTIAVYGEDKFHRLYGDIPPVDEHRVRRSEHLATVKLKDRELLLLDTPGHAYHHYCVYDAVSAGVFSGDTFGVSYPNMLKNGTRVVIPTTTPIHFNPEALHQSVDLLMSYLPSQIFLTHFSVLPKPQDSVDQYRAWIDRFVELTEQVQPHDDQGTEDLIERIGTVFAEEFGFSADMIEHQLANDIRLNAQGLAYWFQHREQ